MIFILLSILAVQTHGQPLFKKDAAPLCLVFAAGAADGLRELITYHYDRADNSLNLRDDFCDPSVSWKNKYKADLRTERFPGSTTAFVAATDMYHMLPWVRNRCITAALVFSFNDKKDIKSITKRIIAYSIAYSAGNYITLELIR